MSLMATIDHWEDIENDLVDLLLDDQEWVDAEFVAIMNASGFARGVCEATGERPHRRQGDRARDAAPFGIVEGSRPSRARSRVRSPPRG
jgi:hypothetical protein